MKKNQNEVYRRFVIEAQAQKVLVQSQKKSHNKTLYRTEGANIALHICIIGLYSFVPIDTYSINISWLADIEKKYHHLEISLPEFLKVHLLYRGSYSS